ncbi:tryptophan synthase alpha chain [Stella humosa]|uniref:Tryptophan synthase alpha chain n=1 Tax=Stella humosa TaxID=94 RepID=A0A3N1L7Q8_9PROT|nr:tryptophan synthase subunit alpha [Stella humosa]ROP90683.1 tryptophan synthase alpha chain [Stella humosa]BBK29417.1 tryptophan synthase alpha chain [Stella humosa]
MSQGRIARRFAALAREGRAGLVTFVTAGDPDAATAAAILDRLPAAGADVIELGMPFSDPMADGPAVQAAGLRALKAGQTMIRTLDLVRGFRVREQETPIVLMGYFNPILQYGVDRFCVDASAAGVDGLIIVDLPPEEAEPLAVPAAANGIDLIRLVAPTTPEARMPKVMAGASGFIYAVAITGVTGTASAAQGAVAELVARVRRHTDLPVVVGFGINTPAQAAATAAVADGIAVGSAIVRQVEMAIDSKGHVSPDVGDRLIGFVGQLAAGVRSAARVVA